MMNTILAALILFSTAQEPKIITGRSFMLKLIVKSQPENPKLWVSRNGGGTGRP